jgi:hypothetical protein
MGNKFNRSFRLTIQDAFQTSAYYEPALVNDSNLRLTPAINNIANDKSLPQQGKNALVIEIPFTIEIDVNNILAVDGNRASIKIYGLNETNRNKLFQNPWNIPILEDGKKGFRRVILEAGYEGNIYPIFDGVLTQGFSVREGVDWTTNLTCVSSAVGLYNTFINKSYNSGIKQIDVINDIITEMSQYGDLLKGSITTSLDKSYSQGLSLVGESYNILTQFGVDVFIDAGKINVLQVNEAIGNSKSTSQVPPSSGVIAKLGLQVPNITADSGLIGTPILNNDGFVTVNMIFEPAIKLASLVNLESITASFFNGYYKVMGVDHKGVISSSKEGMLITTLKLWSGGSLVNNFNIVAPT